MCVLKLQCFRRLTRVPLAVSYLDIPDLTSLSRASPQLAALTSDPILHRNRLRLTAPSRVAHSLFGTSSGGILLRPSVGELLQRGIIKGLGIERRWRTGGYFYSPRVCVCHAASLKIDLPIADGNRLRECSQTASSSCTKPHLHCLPGPSPAPEYQRSWTPASYHREIRYLREH